MTQPTDMAPTSPATATAVVLARLARRGYTEQFEAADHARLHAIHADRNYRAADLLVDEQIRVEEDTSPDLQTLVFALRTPGGARGTYCVPHGANMDLADARVVQALVDAP